MARLGDTLNRWARQSGIPAQTVDQVRATIADAEKQGGVSCARNMAEMLVEVGNCTDDARDFARDYLNKSKG